MKIKFPCFFFLPFSMWLLKNFKLHMWLAFYFYSTVPGWTAVVQCGWSRKHVGATIKEVKCGYILTINEKADLQ